MPVMADSEFPRPAGMTDDLFPLVYNELRDLAGRRMSRERPGHTLRPTELVHEVFLRMSIDANVVIQNREHFLGLAGRVMHQVLVDYARRRGAIKRGGDLIRVTLDEALGIPDSNSVEILELDQALKRLAKSDSQAADVVVHRYFGGLTEIEIGRVMGRSERWVRDQWAYARAWLRRELDQSQ